MYLTFCYIVSTVERSLVSQISKCLHYVKVSFRVVLKNIYNYLTKILNISSRSFDLLDFVTTFDFNLLGEVGKNAE